MDSHFKSLAAAFIPGSVPRVLGAQLLPFSLWHRFLLRVIESPFLKKGDVHLFDLRNAVGICQLEFPNYVIERPGTWRALLRRGGLKPQVEKFVDYCGCYVSMPNYESVPPPPVKGMMGRVPRGTAPEDIRIVGDIVHWSGWSDTKIWNLPIGAAYWYQAMARRAMGEDLDFPTAMHARFLEGMRASGKMAHPEGTVES